MTNQEVNFGLEAIQATDYNTAKEILQHIKYAILDNEKVYNYVKDADFFNRRKFRYFRIEQKNDVAVLKYSNEDTLGEGNYKIIDSWINEEDSEENARVIKRMLLRLRTLYWFVHQEEALNLAVRFILDLPVIP